MWQSLRGDGAIEDERVASREARVHASRARGNSSLPTQIWDYSINQATLETIFMSFAKDQEEETANVAGVAYRGGGAESQTHPVRDPAPRPAMDVEMGLLRDGGMMEEASHEGGRLTR